MSGTVLFIYVPDFCDAVHLTLRSVFHIRIKNWHSKGCISRGCKFSIL